MKSLNEGIRALMIWVGTQFDIINLTKDEHIKSNAQDIIALMTPILKSFAADLGCESANRAVQIYGGHGYIKDHGMEQLIRDSRIAPIYEGTNGIQALDLIGRKMHMKNGEVVNNFFILISEYLDNISSNAELETFVFQFKKSFDDLISVKEYIESLSGKKINEINGIATEFLQIFSYVSIGFIWLKLLDVSFRKNKIKPSDFYDAKIATGSYFFKKIIPNTSYLKDQILIGASNYNDYKDEYFDSGFSL